jgi:hypothetical protein
MTAPIRNPQGAQPISPDQLIAVVRDYQQITNVFRMMKEHWGLTNKFCDDVLGFTDGHTDKILGPSEQKRWGPSTLHALMELFGIEFRVYLDVEAVKRMEAVWDNKAPRWFKDAKVGRISKKLVERAKPEIYSEMGKRSAVSRMSCLTAEHRSKIARKAAKSRWRKRRREKRAKAAQPAAVATV